MQLKRPQQNPLQIPLKYLKHVDNQKFVGHSRRSMVDPRLHLENIPGLHLCRDRLQMGINISVVEC